MLSLKLRQKVLCVFRNIINGMQMDVLLDTGAAISLFNEALYDIKDIFPEAHNTGARFPLTTPYSKELPYVWIIPKIYMNDIIIYNMPIVIGNLGRDDITFILSAHVFEHNAFTVLYDNWEIQLSNDHKRIYCSFDRKDNKIKSFSVATIDSGEVTDL